MPVTYEPIATTTLGSAQNSVTFSTISGSYTDLVLVTYIPTVSTNSDVYIRVNGDTGSNYSATWLRGNGTSATSTFNSNNAAGYRISDNGSPTTGSASLLITHFMSYSNTTTNKTMISRANNSATGLDATVGLWRNTNAINSITIRLITNNMNTGSIFTLYGVKAA